MTPAPAPVPSWRRTLRSFRFAAAGVALIVRTQPNARVHLAIAAAACALAAWLRIDAVRWAALLLTIALVLSLEAMNTAIEYAVDLTAPRLHPLAGAAKDASAAAVLIAATLSVGVGVGIALLGPALLARLGE